MVQKKMAKSNNKHDIQADTGLLISEKKQSIIKPSLQKNDGNCKSKVADLKAVKMKKSRSIKRSNVDINLLSPQPLVTPAGTPSPKKPLQCKSPCMSPNYMKSTSSSEARKEKRSELNSISSTSKVHNKTNGMKKMRSLSLTKAPSFKHTRSSGSCKKVVLCQTGLDVQKATCSSTLRHSKFPAYLELEPGATEAEGNSVFKVCTYSYCSLNGHHHIAAPPLKRFLSSRRRLLKTLKVRPEVFSPRKAKASECNLAIEGGDQFENFFIEVYAPGREFDSQVSGSLSDGPCSENEFQEKFDQIEVTQMSDMNFSLGGGDYAPAIIQKQASFESLADSLDDFYAENSDMVWEEGQSTVTQDSCEIYVQANNSKDHDKTGFLFSDNTSKYLEFVTDDQVKLDFELKNNSAGSYVEVLAEECPPYFHEEIVECLHFSDTDSFPESESTHTGDKHVKELLMIADDKDSEFNEDARKLEDESMDKHGIIFSDTLERITVAEIRDEEKIAYLVMEEREPSEETLKHTQLTDDLEIFSENEKIYKANEDLADNCLGRRSVNSEDAEDSNKIRLHSDENNDAEVKTSGMDDRLKNKSDFNKGGSEFNLKTLDSCSKLNKVSRCRKAEEDFGAEKDFNPRGPNFLAVEPEQEAEKVDLRQQEMDEKRNAEEWMLDYALQKTVNQLATARKRKVALLVEAFESVRPIPKCESHRRKSSPGFIQTRTIQACS